jgi:hypothetical protein
MTGPSKSVKAEPNRKAMILPISKELSIPIRSIQGVHIVRRKLLWFAVHVENLTAIIPVGIFIHVNGAVPKGNL